MVSQCQKKQRICVTRRLAERAAFIREPHPNGCTKGIAKIRSESTHVSCRQLLKWITSLHQSLNKSDRHPNYDTKKQVEHLRD